MIRQANQVPAGSLNEGWGDIAEAVAIGTAEGVADLLARVEWRPLDRAAQGQ